MHRDLPDILPEVLARHAQARPERIAYRFLADGEVSGATAEWSFGHLAQRVREVAGLLRRDLPAGSRALLLYPGGLEFAAAFLGCLSAGTIAVPAPVPDERRLDRTAPRLARIAGDCGATAVLTTRDTLGLAERAGRVAPGLAGLPRIPTDVPAGPGAGGTLPPAAGVAAADVAFLQYTSGSTGTPRGVMVTHANLAHNLRSLQDAWHQDEDARPVSWLPAFHDMGLIAGLLYPMWLGATATLMTPSSFVQRPMRWLEAISLLRGTLSVAPNFAYDLCVRDSTDAGLAAIDLSTWMIAGNGAEPVRRETMRRFSRRFAAAGFRSGSFAPCYGLAEATLLVTAVRPAASPQHGPQHLPQPEGGDVSCGRPALDTKVVIVDPDTAEPVAEGRTGEIWVGGPSNAAGYWNRPDQTGETFRARLADGGGPYLRTGDLGYVSDGELHVSGRIKDLIIVDGVNYYPQDLEFSAECGHAAVRSGCVAAFAIDDGGRERVVVAAELDPAFGGDAQAVAAAIRAAVAQEHQLDLHAVALLAARTIPKTSSGKIRRRETRERYLDGRLDLRHAWSARPPAQTAESTRSWLIAQVALRTGADPRRIDTRRPFQDYGLASQDVLGMAADLTAWLGRDVSAAAAYAHPSIDALARHLDGAAAPAGPPRAATPRAAAATPVAIVGIGCRFPGADGPAGYWSLLSAGTDAVRDVPAARWNVEDYYHGGGPAPGRMYTRRGGFLDDVTGFDPEFFSMSEAEARHLDPQQRLLLEVAWEALEDAGVLPEQVAGSSTGVFVGITTSDYARMQLAAGVGSVPYAATGNVFCMAANRLSYVFDFRGPSVSLDTACSSSLVAIHQACASIRSGESELALAGGVNLMLSPETTVALCQSGALSADGRCYTFDARANGYVRGEGAGLVLLKPLRQAMQDGDRVYAVIRGSAVNQDGRSNGLTAPSPVAQARVIRDAYRQAGLPPERMRYVELHGTGTALGDPIEAAALGAVLAGRDPGAPRCALGSVKTNIGHLEPAAGVAGLAKVALALHHGQLPPSLHFESPNPHIDLAGLGLAVQAEPGPWPAGEATLVAGVSSFGVGGTNAHVVLEEAPRRPGAAG
jgi:acyl-CoA synthetase (AMP-forming)/AMP-acid ligase II/3-oxoacyl-(acyl-carrier-protein) synthase